MSPVKTFGALARSFAVVLALADGSGGCASCGAPPPEPEPPRNDPLPAPSEAPGSAPRADPLSSARDG